MKPEFYILNTKIYFNTDYPPRPMMKRFSADGTVDIMMIVSGNVELKGRKRKINAADYQVILVFEDRKDRA